MTQNRKQTRRKFSDSFYIDTVYQLYQYLDKLPPLAKLELLYYGTSPCCARTTKGAVRILMKSTFPLYQVIREHGHYTQVEQLVYVLKQRMPQLIAEEKIHAKTIVGSSSINTAYSILEHYKNQGIGLRATYKINSGIIVCAEYGVSYSSFFPATPIHSLLNNGALLYLMRFKLKAYIDQNYHRSIEEYLPIDSVLEEMRETFGSMLFIKLNALNEAINS